MESAIVAAAGVGYDAFASVSRGRSMEKEIRRRAELCERAQNPEWEDLIALAKDFDAAQKAYLREHPPGLVKALWSHFDATRAACGCRSATHERPECTVRLIERLLLDEQSI